MFQVGDFVKVKQGTLLAGGEEATNWAGSVTWVSPKEGTCLIFLDAFSLNTIHPHDVGKN